MLIVIFENTPALHRTSTRGVGGIAEWLYSETSTQRMSITKLSTNRRKKTNRPTSDWETKVFPKRMEKICTDKTVLSYVKGLEIL